jgi:hypothetical protein
LDAASIAAAATSIAALGAEFMNSCNDNAASGTCLLLLLLPLCCAAVDIGRML